MALTVYHLVTQFNISLSLPSSEKNELQMKKTIVDVFCDHSALTPITLGLIFIILHAFKILTTKEILTFIILEGNTRNCNICILQ